MCNMCCKTSRIPSAATSRCLPLPFILHIPGNTDWKTQITLTREADQRAQDKKGEYVLYISAVTGIFNNLTSYSLSP